MHHEEQLFEWEQAMAVFSYIVPTDTGFSPNPFHGICTLACCKPKIRCSAQPGDWVVGLSPKREGHTLVYAMNIKEKVSFDDYWKQKRFAAKKPRFDTRENSVGDNIYEPLPKSRFKQHRSMHSQRNPRTNQPTSREHEDNKKRDLSGHWVLIAEDFVYWGGTKTKILDELLLRELVVGRGHRRIESPEILQRWSEFMQDQPRDIRGSPKHLHNVCRCGCC